MSTNANFVPKVHPLSRSAEPDDPMELMAEAAPGNPNVMLECIVQEFAWMGWDREQIFGLFRNPGYPVLNQLLELFGETEIRQRLGELLANFGILRVRESIDEEPEAEDDELIQLTIRHD